jgi:hypothetical protein
LPCAQAMSAAPAGPICCGARAGSHVCCKDIAGLRLYAGAAGVLQSELLPSYRLPE